VIFSYDEGLTAIDAHESKVRAFESGAVEPFPFFAPVNRPPNLLVPSGQNIHFVRLAWNAQNLIQPDDWKSSLNLLPFRAAIFGIEEAS